VKAVHRENIHTWAWQRRNTGRRSAQAAQGIDRVLKKIAARVFFFVEISG
jgi:hypothetical protein